jgi:hypothetical protein
VGRSSSLSSHVRRDVSRSLGVELDAAYLSALYSTLPSCLIPRGVLTKLGLESSSAISISNRSSSHIVFNVKLSGET